MKVYKILLLLVACLSIFGCSKYKAEQIVEYSIVNHNNKFEIKFDNTENRNMSIKFGGIGSPAVELHKFNIYYAENQNMIVADFFPVTASIGVSVNTNKFTCLYTENKLVKNEYVIICYIIFDETKYNMSIEEIESDINSENYSFPVQICLN